jgi:hypothetical protein
VRRRYDFHFYPCPPGKRDASLASGSDAFRRRRRVGIDKVLRPTSELTEQHTRAGGQQKDGKNSAQSDCGKMQGSEP